MEILITTFIKRPYVFAFLAAFLFLSIRHQGLLRTFVWLLVGYFIAFVSEYSSIHNGFPYGEYHYIYENLQGELIFAGVPVWDSISYSFMSYAGFGAALYSLPRAKLWKITLLGAFLMTMLDIITDPVAKLGKQWFLGEIYYYANEGAYFGVPFSNFAGWFLVAFAIIGTNMGLFYIFKFFRRNPELPHPAIFYPLFYFSICLFNIVIAFYIGAIPLALVNLAITAFLLCITLGLRKTNRSQGL